MQRVFASPFSSLLSLSSSSYSSSFSSIPSLLFNRGAKTLVVAEHDNKTLNPATLRAVAAAGKLGGEVSVLVAGKDVSSIAQSVSKIQGVSKVLVAKNDSYEHPVAESFAPLIQNTQKQNQFTHIIATGTTFSKNLFPRAAALLDVSPISDVIKIENENTFKRPIYAGDAIATVQSEDSVKVLTVRGTAFDKAPSGSGNAEIVEIPAGETSNLTKWESAAIAKSERPDLTAASIVVSGGRAVKSKENFDSLIISLADAFGAAVGASRAAVDAGYAPNDAQVGQTGKIVAPELYIAVGISGAVQHLAGMKDSKVIVAINKDAEAPIFSVADYGLVGDLFTVLPELTKKVKELKGK